MAKSSNRRRVEALAFLAVAACALWAVRPNQGKRLQYGPVSAGGTELVYVLVASTDCWGVRDPRLGDALDASRSYLESYAAQRGYGFSTVGVAIDRDIDAGWSLLERFGPFDEAHVGRSYLNSAAQRFLVTLPGVEGTPQLIVLEREIVADGGIVRIRAEKVLLRKLGAEEIIRWSLAAVASEPRANGGGAGRNGTTRQ